jgi:hypothetical protein
MTAGTDASPCRSRNETPSSRASCPRKPAAAMGDVWGTWWFPCRRKEDLRGGGRLWEGGREQMGGGMVRLFSPAWDRSANWEEGMQEMGGKERDGRREGPSSATTLR